MALALADPTIRVLPDERPPWRVVIGALIIGAVITILGAQAAILSSLATEKVWLAQSEVEFRDSSLLPETVAVTFASPSIWNPVADREGISDTVFQKHYSAGVAGGTQIIRITYEDVDPDRARRVVNGVVDAYILRFAPALAPPDPSPLLEEQLLTLRSLEVELVSSLQDRDLLTPEVEVDKQNQLIKTRQQITAVILRQDERQVAYFKELERRPRRLTDAFIHDKPVSPEPLKALIFGTAAGGLVAVVAVYLAFHRTAQPSAPVGKWGTSGMDRAMHDPRSVVAPPAATPETPIGGPFSRFFKRAIDVIASFFALVIFSPLMLLVAVAIKLTSRGPVLFKQERVGRGGSTFQILKFRTMTANNDDTEHREFVTNMLTEGTPAEGVGSVYKLIDSRVTRVGSVLRRFSLDELPQLWNVLRGQMSLVGPRPALPWEWDLFSQAHKLRVRALPGCTGLWQVSGRNLLTTGQMLDLDLEYVERFSVLRDLGILIRTPLAIVRGDGAR